MKGRIAILVVPLLLWCLYHVVSYYLPFFQHMIEYKEWWCMNENFSHFPNNGNEHTSGNFLVASGRILYVIFIGIILFIIGIIVHEFYFLGNNKITNLLDAYFSFNAKDRKIAKLKLLNIRHLVQSNSEGKLSFNMRELSNNKDKYYRDWDSSYNTADIKPEYKEIMEIVQTKILKQ